MKDARHSHGSCRSKRRPRQAATAWRKVKCLQRQEFVIGGWVPVFAIFLLKQSFDMLPREYEDAAKMDGAGMFTIIFRVYGPLLKPPIVALIILTFLGIWNDYIWPMYTVSGHPELYPIAYMISQIFLRHHRITTVLALDPAKQPAAMTHCSQSPIPSFASRQQEWRISAMTTGPCLTLRLRKTSVPFSSVAVSVVVAVISRSVLRRWGWSYR